MAVCMERIGTDRKFPSDSSVRLWSRNTEFRKKPKIVFQMIKRKKYNIKLLEQDIFQTHEITSVRWFI